MKKILVLASFALLSACSAPVGSGSGGSGGGGGTADAGNTPECTRTADCANNERCVDNVCVEEDPGCQSDNDCDLGEACENGQCVEPTGCTSDAQCTEDQTCQNGACVSGRYGACTSDAECAEGLACNHPTQQGSVCSEACQAASDCMNYETCVDQANVCSYNTGCDTPGALCDGHGTGDGQCLGFPQGNLCVANTANGLGCSAFGDGEACEGGLSCRMIAANANNTFCGEAGQGAAGTPCQNGLFAGSDMGGTEDCAQGNICVALEQGTLCLGYCRVGHNEDCGPLQGQDTVCQALGDIIPQLAGSPWGLCVPPQEG